MTMTKTLGDFVNFENIPSQIDLQGLRNASIFIMVCERDEGQDGDHSDVALPPHSPVDPKSSIPPSLPSWTRTNDDILIPDSS